MASDEVPVSLAQLKGPGPYVPNENIRFVCPVQSCSSGGRYTRADNLQRHTREQHGDRLDYTTVIVEETDPVTAETTLLTAAQYVDRIWKGHVMPTVSRRGVRFASPGIMGTGPNCFSGRTVPDDNEIVQGPRSKDPTDRAITTDTESDVETNIDTESEGSPRRQEIYSPMLQLLYNAQQMVSKYANVLIDEGYNPVYIIDIQRVAHEDVRGAVNRAYETDEDGNITS